MTEPMVLGHPITRLILYFFYYAFLGWFLEAATHMKYWDYSHIRFNLNGRICLPISLTWGVLSYVIIYWVHPFTEQLFARIAPWLSYVLCGVAIGILISDATLTIRELALVSKLTQSVSRLRGELQLSLSLGKAELGDKLDETASALRERYNEQLRRLERNGRRFFRHYHVKPNTRYHVSLEDLRAAAELAAEELRRASAARKREREQRRKK